MPKKPKKIDGKKVGGVDKAAPTDQIKETESVSELSSVKKASGVAPVSSTGKAGQTRSTRTLTHKEREKIFAMIEEEAEKLFKDSDISPGQQKTIADAVKMAVDSGLIDEEEQEGEKD